MIVGLTGGIGSGKSTVAKLFKNFGIPVYDSDFEAKQLMHINTEVVSEITKLFGDEAYKEGVLNRPFIAERVFSDRELLNQLNEIVHPAVKEHFSNWVASQNSPYVIQETALIFEQNNQDYYDKVILITAPLDLRIKRVIYRDQISEEAVINRVQNQLADAKKIDLADYVIENVDLKETEEMVAELHRKLLEISGN